MCPHLASPQSSWWSVGRCPCLQKHSEVGEKTSFPERVTRVTWREKGRGFGLSLGTSDLQDATQKYMCPQNKQTKKQGKSGGFERNSCSKNVI